MRLRDLEPEDWGIIVLIAMFWITLAVVHVLNR